MILQQKNERNLMGGRDMWSSIFPFMDFGYFILGWFTVTIEVFLRRDFGERYFNRMNFLAGFLILGFWAIIVGGLSAAMSSINLTGRAGMYGNTVGAMGGFSSAIFLMWLAYIVLSVLHFIRIWWRNRTNRPLHSLDAGRSNILWLGELLIGLVNIIAAFFIKLFALTLSAEDKEKLNQLLPLVTDVQAFTERFLEPVLVWLLGFIFVSLGSGILGFWLVFSAVALSLYTNYRYEAERHHFLDIRDQLLEAQYMPDAIAGLSDVIRLPNSVKETMKQTAERVNQVSPKVMEQVRNQNPTLADAMAALNPKLRDIATETNPS